MSVGIRTIKVRIAGAAQFVDTSPIAVFAPVDDFPVNYTARIIGYAYNSAGSAHDVRLVLTPQNVVTGSDEDIILESRSGGSRRVNSFTSACGPEGIVVPRRYGTESTAQPIVVPGDEVTSGETYFAFFSTNGKTDDGTFYLWYHVEQLDGGGA